jgi:hypothetical protein
MQAFTDNNGKAQVTITVPSDAAFGSTLKVQASTQSIWPQEYLDLTSYTSSAQNLIGASTTLNLDVSTSIAITGFITVLPESGIGVISIVAAFGAGFIIYSKLKHSSK